MYTCVYKRLHNVQQRQGRNALVENLGASMSSLRKTESVRCHRTYIHGCTMYSNSSPTAVTPWWKTCRKLVPVVRAGLTGVEMARRICGLDCELRHSIFLDCSFISPKRSSFLSILFYVLLLIASRSCPHDVSAPACDTGLPELLLSTLYIVVSFGWQPPVVAHVVCMYNTTSTLSV